MNRRLATTLASAALFAFVSVPAALSGAQPAQEGQPTERTGQKVTKAVMTSCPVHPEIKARTAGKCSKCRMQERNEKSARDKNKVRQQQGTGANE